MALHPAEQFVIAVRQMERRAKGDAQKLALAVRLRAETAVTVKWIAERLRMPQHTSSRFATFSPFDARKVIKAERKERSRVWRPGVLTLNRISVDERLSAVQFFAPRRFWAGRSLFIHGAWRRSLRPNVPSNGPRASKPKRQPGATTRGNPSRP